jgi:tetratricopeptide (TPR) repeat protein
MVSPLFQTAIPESFQGDGAARNVLALPHRQSPPNCQVSAPAEKPRKVQPGKAFDRFGVDVVAFWRNQRWWCFMAEKTLDTIDRTARDFYQKAMGALDRNNLDYAIEMFMQTLNVEPNFLKARQFLRAAQMKRNESAGGFKRMLTAARTAPLLTKAKMAAGKNPTEAMSLAEQVLTEDSKSGPALIVLAEAAESAGFPETAVQTLEYYTKLYPRDAKALHMLARIQIAVENFEAAREIYERLLAINPNDFAAQKGLKDTTAQGAMQSGGWEQAESYRDVIRDKEEAVALEQESRMVRAEDMVENLIRENLAKLKHDPRSPVVRRKLGELYGQKGDYETALRYLEELFAEEGGADPSLEKEIAGIKTKRLEPLIKEKKSQRDSSPAHAEALSAEIEQLEKEHAKLQLREAERLVERYPNDLMYRYDLGVLYMKTGDIPRAIEQFQRSVGQPQRRVSSLNYLGQCFFSMGLYDLASDQYKKAIDELPMMDGLKKDLVYNLGLTYDAMGESEKAIAEYKKIAAVDFGFRDIKDRITRKPPAPAA